MKKWDVIVFGLGGGSSVLYHLARQGLTVLGLDQYPELTHSEAHTGRREL